MNQNLDSKTLIQKIQSSKVCTNQESLLVAQRLKFLRRRKKSKILDDVSVLAAEEKSVHKAIVRNAESPLETNWNSTRLKFLREQGIDLGEK